MKTNRIHSLRRRAAGITLVEILVASFLGVIVMGLLVSSLIMNLRGQRITTTHNENIHQANQCLQRIIYGFDGTPGLREANSDEFVPRVVPGGVILDFGVSDGRNIVYNEVAQTVVGDNGEVYASGVTAFHAEKSGSLVILSLTIRDDSLKQPVEQTLQGEIVLRNKNVETPFGG